MELRHLRYFLAVAEAGHFGRAAARLGMAQPPLSVQIRDLERHLGVALLHRTARGAVLTEAGQAFAPRAAAILEQATAAVGAARDAAAGRGGRLAIGFIHSLAYSLLPALLPAWRTRFPSVAVTLHEVIVTQKEDALLEGRVDIMLVRPPPRHPALGAAILTREAMLLALPRDHRLARLRRVPVAALAEEPLICFPAHRGDPGLQGAVAGFLRRHEVAPLCVQEAGTIHTALGLVLAGAGLAVVPESAALLRLSGLAFRPFAEPPAMVEVALAFRLDDANPLLAGFRDVARQAVPMLPPIRS